MQASFSSRARAAIVVVLCQLIVLQPLALHSPRALAQSCEDNQQNGGEGLPSSNEEPESPDDSTDADGCPGGVCGEPESANSLGEPIGDLGQAGDLNDGDFGSGDAAFGNTAGDHSGNGGDDGNPFGMPPTNPDDTDWALFNPGLSGFSNYYAENVAADPIETLTGNKRHVQVDYRSYGYNPLKLVRVYNSLPSEDQAAKSVDFGLGWRTSYDRSLSTPTSSVVHLHRPNGRILVFNLVGGQWQGSAGGRLSFDGRSTWTYINKRNEVENYDVASKRMTRLTRNGQTTRLVYSDASPSARLVEVNNGAARRLLFWYNAAGRVSSVTLPGGGTLGYAYSAAGQLLSVTFTDATTRIYHYEDASNPRALTGITDEAGRRFASWSYDATGRATFAEFAGGANRLWLYYGANQTTTVDHRGVQRVRTFQTFGSARKLVSRTTSIAGVNVTPPWTQNYDTSGRLLSVVDRRGETRTFTRDSRDRTLSFTRGSGTGAQMTTTHQWHADYEVPAVTQSRGVTTTRQLDAGGRLTQVSRTGPDGRTETRSVTYSSYGAPISIAETGPRYATTVAYSSAAQGMNVTSVTTPSGHITRYLAYDSHGQPTLVQHPDGTLVSFTYDVRGRLTSRTVGRRSTQFAYDGAGLLSRVTLPDGRWHAFSYNNARRLTRISNERGERIDHTRDAAGDIVETRVTNNLGDAVARRTYARDAVGRLTSVAVPVDPATQVLGPMRNALQVGYTSTGDAATHTNALNEQRAYQRDIVGRVTSAAESPLPATTRSFDGNGRVATITSPRGVAASYGYDSFNRQTAESRSEFGTRSAQRREDGLPTRTQSANGVALDLTWDDQRRLVSATAAGGGMVTLSYVGGVPISLVGAMTDPSGSTNWTYDAGGRVLSKTQIAGGISRTLSYVRNDLGLPTQITYPSGVTVYLSWTNGLLASLGINGQTVLQQVRYFPMSTRPVGWTWGNGTVQERSLDGEGRPIAVTVGNTRQTNEFDALGRIVRQRDIAGSGAVLADRLFTYNRAGHIVQSQASSSYPGASHLHTHSFDASGDRTGSVVDGAASSYAYDPARPHRLTAVGSRTYSYDAAGNTLSDGLRSYSYNSFGRLSRVIRGAAIVDSTYNGQGLRVLKTATVNGVPSTTLFFYDHAGRLLGEYGADGSLIQETVWFGNVPVATIRPNGIFYVQADHLGTPRAAIRPSDNAVVWRWDSDAFGTTPAFETTPGGIAFKYHLRFPGQYLDTETGLHYNVFRDYDSQSGRYVQSDPLGLVGGINTYAYVGGNPIGLSDPGGLDVTVCLYSGAGAAGHVGVGVNTSSTVGLYPKKGGVAALFGTPGVIKPDTGKVEQCKTLETTPEADQRMLDFIDATTANPGGYSLAASNCTSFVRAVLKQGGIVTPPVGPGPRALMQTLP